MGWGLFVSGNILSAYVQGAPMQGKYLVSLFIFIIGIGITHLFRLIVHRGNWTRLPIPALIPRVLLASCLMSFLFMVLNTIFTNVTAIPSEYRSIAQVLDGIFSIPFFVYTLSFSALFLLWSILYFAVHVFENWKREEIVNLELKATQTEMELNSFKAQMNPHFMFNSLNSIRALIDEDPIKAKTAITSLSGILRNNLALSRSQTVPLSEELDLVEKYLSLEKIRFESRLVIEQDIDPQLTAVQIPPFILQTIVENGIKHGISSRVEGGRMAIKISRKDDDVKIAVTSSGSYAHKPHEQKGIGLENSKKRLQLIYNGRAHLEVIPLDDEVNVIITIPFIHK